MNVKRGSVVCAALLAVYASSSEAGVDEGMKSEAACFGVAFASDDMQEGVKAFIEKRKPQFQ